MRAFSIACLALPAMLAFVGLRRVGYGRLAAWIFAAGSCGLLSTQVMASWAILLMAPFALVLADPRSNVVRHRDGQSSSGGWEAQEDGITISAFDRAALGVGFLCVPTCRHGVLAFRFLLLLAPARRGWPLRALFRGTLAAGAIGAAAALVGYAAIVVDQTVLDTSSARTALVLNVGGKVSYLEQNAFPCVSLILEVWLNYTLAHLVFLALVLLVPSLCPRRGESSIHLRAAPVSWWHCY